MNYRKLENSLRKYTNNWTSEKGEFPLYNKEDTLNAKEILEKHYDNVDNKHVDHKLKTNNGTPYKINYYGLKYIPNPNPGVGNLGGGVAEELEDENSSSKEVNEMKIEKEQLTEKINEPEINVIANGLMDLIKDELEAIQGYNDFLNSINANSEVAYMNETISHIIEEENKHIGELKTLQGTIAGYVQAQDEGEQEAKEEMAGEQPKESLEETIDPSTVKPGEYEKYDDAFPGGYTFVVISADPRTPHEYFDTYKEAKKFLDEHPNPDYEYIRAFEKKPSSYEDDREYYYPSGMTRIYDSLEEEFLYDRDDWDDAREHAKELGGELESFNYETGVSFVRFPDGSYIKYDVEFNELPITSKDAEEHLKYVYGNGVRDANILKRNGEEIGFWTQFLDGVDSVEIK